MAAYGLSKLKFLLNLHLICAQKVQIRHLIVHFYALVLMLLTI